MRRSTLIERLAHRDSARIVSVVAPAGYGKTTLLSQWAERTGQSVAWISVEEADNDPKVLLSYISEALDQIEPIGERVFDALASPVSSVPGTVVPRLASAFSTMTSPVALVVDDVHLLWDSEARAALAVLVDHVPDGSRLALAGRADPPLRIARLRAEGKLLEIGPEDLSLTPDESAVLLHAAGTALDDVDVAELHRRTEGWPAGLYLAALYIKEGGSPARAAASFGGDDRFMSDYLESELLSQITRQQRTFLTRTAVLERMCEPLCHAVVDMSGSAPALADLTRSNLLLVPLDRRHEWYRYHHLFRDMLLAELHRREPHLLPELQRRAATWCLRNGLPEEALEYSIAATDVATVEQLVNQLWLSTWRRGRLTTVLRWLQWLEDHGGIKRHSALAVQASLAYAVTGRPAEAERWAAMFDRWRHEEATAPHAPFTEALAALVRAILCRRGIDAMRADADEALQICTAENIVTPAPALFQGIARVLAGDLTGGDASFRDAASIGEAGAPEVLALALSERALVAMMRDEWSPALTLADSAWAILQRVGMEESYATPLVCAVQARTALHRGDGRAVRQKLVDAQRLRNLLTHAVPHLALQARIQLIHVHLARADIAGARTLMREIDETLERRPGLGALVTEAESLRDRIPRQRGSIVPGASSLTAAELRLLPLLSTHLSFPEIAAEMYLSPHTVKSHVRAIYRKLGASTRTQAVTEARELGLLDE